MRLERRYIIAVEFFPEFGSSLLNSVSSSSSRRGDDVSDFIRRRMYHSSYDCTTNDPWQIRLVSRHSVVMTSIRSIDCSRPACCYLVSIINNWAFVRCTEQHLLLSTLTRTDRSFDDRRASSACGRTAVLFDLLFSGPAGAVIVGVVQSVGSVCVCLERWRRQRRPGAWFTSDFTLG